MFITLAWIILLSLAGCNEDFNSHGTSINGNVSDDNNFPGYFILEISLGYPPNANPDMEGNFHLESTIFPYNLEVKRRTTRICFIKGITTVAPHFASDILWGGTNYVWGDISFPFIQENKTGKICFISKENFKNHLIDNYIESGRNSCLLDLDISENRSEIEGYVCFLQYSGYGNNVLSYDNFGIKYVKLKTEMLNEIIFTEQDINYNPPEREINCYTNDNYNNVYLQFQGYSLSSNLLIQKEIYPYSGVINVIVPDSMPLPFNIKAESTYGFNYPSNKKITYLSKLSEGFITNEPFIQVSTPQNFETNINDNTEFASGSASPDKINVFDFLIFNKQSGLNNRSFTYYTRSNSISLHELKSAGLEYFKNDTVRWHIEQIGNFNSMDEFLGMNYYTNPKFTDYLVSELRFFVVQ